MAVSYTNLLVARDADGILTITVNRPQALNALNMATIEELALAIGEATVDPATRAVLLTGAGPKAFVAGADITEFTQLTAETGRRLSQRGQYVFSMFERSVKPVVAAVNGFALGAGCELAMACHLRIAAENARFGQPEVNLGLPPGYGGTQRLVQLVGKGRALELLMTADMVNATEAHRLGLVNHVVPADQLLDFSKKLLLKVLTKAPLAVGAVITAALAGAERPTEGYTAEANAFASCCETADFAEGRTAFLEKRPAAFTGS